MPLALSVVKSSLYGIVSLERDAMKMLRHLSLAIVLLACWAVAAWAGGPVWMISKGDARLYIGGTIHVLDRDDYPLPEAFDQAYRQAAEVVLETDLDQLQNPKYQQLMLKEMLLGEGETLQKVLQPATWKALTDYTASRGIPLANLQKFKPSMLVLALTAAELQRLGLAGTGVDQYFLQRAKQDHKRLGKLESVEAQLAFLADMGAGQEDAMVMQSLQDLEQLPAMMKSLKAAWRRGDRDAIAGIALGPWKKAFPGVYESLLVTRNRTWLPQIEALLKTPEVELVLVGTLHLVGEDGILRQLAADGYTVEQL